MEDTLKVNQILKATIWLKEHRKHVYNMVFNSRDEYPPTDNEDKNNPNLWKPEHWKWFLHNAG
jgi:hypothetical protein